MTAISSTISAVIEQAELLTDCAIQQAWADKDKITAKVIITAAKETPGAATYSTLST